MLSSVLWPIPSYKMVSTDLSKARIIGPLSLPGLAQIMVGVPQPGPDIGRCSAAQCPVRLFSWREKVVAGGQFCGQQILVLNSG